MKARWEKAEKNEGTLHIEVDKEQVNQALDQAFKKVVKQVEVPGFRKGRVPRGLFEKRFGVESLYQDALDILLPRVYTEAVAETEIEPIDQPEVDVEQFEKDKELIFTAKVQVKPEVTLGEYKGLEVPEKDFTVSEDDVNAELEQMRERHAELIVIEEGEVQDGDTVVLDFEGFKDGVPFEGGQAENHSLEIGSGSFIPGFEEQLVGLNKADEAEIEVTFPEEYHSEELKGQQAIFKVQIHEIKRKKLPELDDDFALDVSEHETLEEYKEELKKTLQESKDREKEQYQEMTVVDQAAENAEVDVPTVMIEHEIDQMLQEFGQNLRMQGMTLENYYQFSGQDEEALREQMKEDAQKRVLNSLVLTAIAEAESISATDEELDEELNKMGEMYQQSAEEIRMILEANGALENVKRDVEVRKTVKLLVEHSKSVPEVA